MKSFQSFTNITIDNQEPSIQPLRYSPDRSRRSNDRPRSQASNRSIANHMHKITHRKDDITPKCNIKFSVNQYPMFDKQCPN